ncbi:MAG: HPP family protein [Pseudorhodoplanes sp.]|nr:HPP family protein [Pseudorhodoplanes sp.]
MLAGAVGGAVAIGIMEFLSLQWDFPLAVIPFATSIVLVMGLPDAPPAQPRALIGGHVVCALIGIMVVKLTGPQAWAAALAVGLSMVAMHETRTFHPPAGINPLLIVWNDLSWSFLVVPVAAGAVLLTIFACGWHRVTRSAPWPQARRWD